MTKHEEQDMAAVGTLESFADRKVGEIAATLPGATGVFRELGIDFCCQGEMRSRASRPVFVQRVGHGPPSN